MDSDEEGNIDDGEDFYSYEDDGYEVEINIKKIDDGKVRDILEEKLEKAEYIFEKLQTYIMHNGLNILNKPQHTCVSNMLELL